MASHGLTPRPCGVRRAVPVLLLAALFAAPGATEEPTGVRPPVSVSGMPLPDGGHLWIHAGQNPPPEVPGWRWVLRREGTRRFEGRDVDVVRYVAQPLDPAAAGAPPPAYGQADFVDPRTGEVVGGLDGWGHEGYPAEGNDPLPCPGR